MKNIPDYKRAVEVDGRTVVIDEQVPVEERTELQEFHIHSFDQDSIRLCGEFLNERMGEDIILFHTEYGRGFVVRDGMWEELTSITDFFRGIYGKDWNDIRE